jgi:hypothetical protein
MILYDIWYDMIYLLTTIGLTPSGSSTVHIYAQAVQRTTQNKQYVERHKNFGRVLTLPRIGEEFERGCSPAVHPFGGAPDFPNTLFLLLSQRQCYMYIHISTDVNLAGGSVVK